MGSCTVFSGNAKSHHMSWPLCKSRVFPIIMCMCSRMHNFSILVQCDQIIQDDWIILPNINKYFSWSRSLWYLFYNKNWWLTTKLLSRSEISMFYICSLLSNTVNKELIFSNHCFWIETIHIPYFLIQFPWILFFFEFGNPKVTVHKTKGHST